MRTRPWILALSALCFVACGDDEETESAEDTPAIASEGASLEDWVEPGDEPGERRGPDPHSQAALQQAAGPGMGPQPDNVRAVQGTIRERLDAAGYTYFRVETDAGDVWIAAMRPPVDVGDEVTAVGTLMQDFRSNALDRTFGELLLAGRVVEGSEMPPPGQGAGGPHGGMPGGNPHGGGMPAGNPHGGGTPGGNPHGGGMPAGNPHGGMPSGSPHGGMPAGSPHGGSTGTPPGHP